jgi:hypothetical protein
VIRLGRIRLKVRSINLERFDKSVLSDKKTMSSKMEDISEYKQSGLDNNISQIKSLKKEIHHNHDNSIG